MLVWGLWTSLLTLRIKTVRQTPYKFTICLAGSGFDLLPRCVLTAVGNVRRYCARKQHRIL